MNSYCRGCKIKTEFKRLLCQVVGVPGQGSLTVFIIHFRLHGEDVLGSLRQWKDAVELDGEMRTRRKPSQQSRALWDPLTP